MLPISSQASQLKLLPWLEMGLAGSCSGSHGAGLGEGTWAASQPAVTVTLFCNPNLGLGPMTVTVTHCLLADAVWTGSALRQRGLASSGKIRTRGPISLRGWSTHSTSHSSSCQGYLGLTPRQWMSSCLNSCLPKLLSQNHIICVRHKYVPASQLPTYLSWNS